MSQDNYKYRLFSNDLEGDDSFVPDDRVWKNIDAALHEDKPDRKPFIFFLFSILASLFIVSFFLINTSNPLESSSSTVLNSSSKSSLIKNQSNGLASTNTDQNNIEISSSAKATDIVSVNEADDPLINKVKTKIVNGLSETSSQSTSTSLPTIAAPINHHQNATKIHITETNHIELSNSSSTTVRNQTNSDDNMVLLATHPNSKVDSDDLPLNLDISNVSNQFDRNAEDPQLNDAARLQPKLQTHFDTKKEDFHRANLVTEKDEIGTAAEPQITATVNEQIAILPLPTTILGVTQHSKIDIAYWNNKMTIVDLGLQANPRAWSIEILPYASTSTYVIEDFTGFNAIDFDLVGDRSFGVQLMTKKQLSDRLSLGVGIGLDNSHFNADYGIVINQDELEVSELGANYQAVITKNLPSLAGGLTTSFNVLGTSANLQTNNIQLNLAHNYRTLTAPIQIEYSFIQSARFELFVGAGLLLSKRLLTIDTGVNQLEGNRDAELVELASVAAAELTSQPFRVYNAATTANLAIEYSLTKALKLGIQSRFARPLFNIYEDQNYKVRSQQYQVGLSLSYSL